MSKLQNKISKTKGSITRQDQRDLPKDYKRVFTIVEDGEFYKLSKYFALINGVIDIPYSIHPDLLSITDHASGISINANNIINEILDDVTIQLATAPTNIIIHFHRVDFTSPNAALQILPVEPYDEEPGTIMFSLLRQDVNNPASINIS